MQSFAGSEGINGPVQTTEPVNLSRRIKERALLEGFDLVGIVAAEPLNDESARLKEWLARGYHGEMSWMARDPETRTNPCKLFPQARSVIVVALNYYTPVGYSGADKTGKVSRYA